MAGLLTLNTSKTTGTSSAPVSVTLQGQSPTSGTVVGAAVNLGVLNNGTTVTLLPPSAGNTDNGTILQIGEILGSSTISNLGYNDVIDVTGVPTLVGNVIKTATGYVTLSAPPQGTQYTVVTTPDGNSQVVLTPKTVDIYRFFDSIHGTQFYTGDMNERNTVLATRPDLVPEGKDGVGLEAIDPSSKDPNAVPVFRFFDAVLGTHFFTASASERDTVQATRPDLVYEANNVFYEHAAQQIGDVPVYRFFESTNGTHFYTDSETERASILTNRPDLIAEGIGFYEPPKSS